ncbi:MAG TPA: hypothetical protein VN633_02060 [Bryobacteraceae bacterium]|nr:hypothetical protein [Bryobacteraceae bacterium]
MRLKTGLITAAVAAMIAALAALVLVMPRLHIEPDTTDKPPSTPLRRTPKPSPAVPLKENKRGSSPEKPTQAMQSPDTLKTLPPDGMQFAAHHKGFRGCDGMLTLKTSGLEFTCPGDSGKSFFVAVTDIRGADEDGIVTTSGKKYHFDKLPSGGKEYAERLFSDWLVHVRHAQAPVR